LTLDNNKEWLLLDIVNVTEENIEIFSKVLMEAALWLQSVDEPMWKTKDLTAEELLKKYDINDMKMGYENGSLIGVYVLQWQDPLFWEDIRKDESGFLHKFALSRECVKKGYGNKLIESAALLCREHGVNCLRLNCGTFRPKLRGFYESNGFRMVDRVFTDNRDQIRYERYL
jgi:GNAT superfamily N-acetyltransferase